MESKVSCHGIIGLTVVPLHLVIEAKECKDKSAQLIKDHLLNTMEWMASGLGCHRMPRY